MEDTLNLGKVKTFLETWSGENVDQAYSLLCAYANAMRENGNPEEFVKQYLGDDLYERLNMMIQFFKKFEKFKLDWSNNH
tara:strand:+ start:359 stop:598 length:240 start_codon:yes stop_codon:yes gene_type:complete